MFSPKLFYRKASLESESHLGNLDLLVSFVRKIWQTLVKPTNPSDWAVGLPRSSLTGLIPSLGSQGSTYICFPGAPPPAVLSQAGTDSGWLECHLSAMFSKEWSRNFSRRFIHFLPSLCSHLVECHGISHFYRKIYVFCFLFLFFKICCFPQCWSQIKLWCEPEFSLEVSRLSLESLSHILGVKLPLKTKSETESYQMSMTVSNSQLSWSPLSFSERSGFESEGIVHIISWGIANKWESLSLKEALLVPQKSHKISKWQFRMFPASLF